MSRTSTVRRERPPVLRDDAARDTLRGHALRLDHVTHRFGPVTAIDGVTLDIKGGELIALLGPSGCGKTTLLRIIAGFIRQSEGRVLVDGAPIDHLAPTQRMVGIVFQNYALFPHMSVAENVAYGLAARHWPRRGIARKVDEMLALVQLDALRERLPRQLSGGQQQRTAIARAMAVEPKILLLDEPFGALDKNLRLDMQIEVKRIQRELGITSILVTHDQEEALSMADRIAVINQGRLEQFSPPSELYDQPRTLFVNQFVGTTNLIPGRVSKARDGSVLEIRLGDGGRIACNLASRARQGAEVWLSARPEQLILGAGGRGAAGDGIAGRIAAVMPLGPTVVFEVRTADGVSIKISENRRGIAIPASIGAPVAVKLAHKAAGVLFEREDDARDS